MESSQHLIIYIHAQASGSFQIFAMCLAIRLGFEPVLTEEGFVVGRFSQFPFCRYEDRVHLQQLLWLNIYNQPLYILYQFIFVNSLDAMLIALRTLPQLAITYATAD